MNTVLERARAARDALVQARERAAAVENAAAALKRWFGASKIVDDDGEPLVMYHGTYKDFAAFDRMASAWRGPSIDMIGSWFSNSPGERGAGMYAPGGAIYPVYLRVTRPKYYDSFREMLNAMHEAEERDPAQQKPAGRGSPEGLRDQLKAQGFDGIALSQTNVGEQEADLGEVLAAIRRAKDEEYGAPKSERAVFTAKRERLEGTAKRLRDELATYGGSIEFDGQTVVIVFDPEQVKSALGNSGAYDPNSASMVDSAAPMLDSVAPALTRARVASALAAKVAHYSQGASMPALERMRLAREIRDLITQLGGASRAVGAAAAPIEQLQDIARGLKDGADLADLLEQIKGAVGAILAADALGDEAADQADAAITRWAELEEMKHG